MIPGGVVIERLPSPNGGHKPRWLVAASPVRALVARELGELPADVFLAGYARRFRITVRTAYRHVSALAGELLELNIADQLVTYCGSHLALTHPELYRTEVESDAA